MSAVLTPPVSAPRKIELHVRGVGSQFVNEITEGDSREIACFGARGDGKTNDALIGMLQFAKRHAEAGYPLPVRVMGVTDTHQAHRVKTVRSMLLPHWGGGWHFRSDFHEAIFTAGGTDWVAIDLFGIEDAGAMDRVRGETHLVWFEEPAPAAVMVASSGVSLDAWLIALTSQRLPTYRKVGFLTSNYPDEDHWTWERFIATPQPGTCAFRIPPGERASAADRAEWEKALAGRPDLLRRLVAGEPGVIAMGPQVAVGFREDLHVSPTRLAPRRGESLIFAWDGGHTPTCLIGQYAGEQLRIFASLTIPRGGMRQLIEGSVLPWLARSAPWALDGAALLHGGDPTLDTGEAADIDQSPLRVIDQLMGGQWIPGAVAWPARIDPLLALLGRHSGLVIDPVDGKPLIQALSGRWYYPQDRNGKVSRDLPRKPNHPWEDLGDCLCYLVGRALPEVKRKPLVRPVPVLARGYAVR